MIDLHAAISAALDREQAQAEQAQRVWRYMQPALRGNGAAHIAAQDPARTLRRVEAERRVLARHSPPLGACDWCALWPDCPELLDLAARYDVETSR